MGRNSQTKRLQRYLVLKNGLLQDNLEQWAKADEYLGLEQVLRADQVKAIKTDNIEESRKIHDKRVGCLEKALEILKACPACDHPHEETEDEG